MPCRTENGRFTHPFNASRGGELNHIAARQARSRGSAGKAGKKKHYRPGRGCRHGGKAGKAFPSSVLAPTPHPEKLPHLLGPGKGSSASYWCTSAIMACLRGQGLSQLLRANQEIHSVVTKTQKEHRQSTCFFGRKHVFFGIWLAEQADTGPTGAPTT